MPGLDRQGPPNGEGNQSGRRQGKCNPANKNQENLDEQGFFGRRLGRGKASSFGYRFRNHQGEGRGLGRGYGRRNFTE